MIRCLVYPNYTDHFTYYENDNYINLKRWAGGKIVYRHLIEFDTSTEAKEYFENNCGA